MAVSTLAADLPAPQVSPTPPSIAAAASSAGTAVVAPNFPASVDWRITAANPVAAILDNLASLFGISVLSGLGIATATGLNVTVAAGAAFIGGFVEFAGGTKVLPNATDNVYLWLRQNKVLDYTLTASPPGSGLPACYIGRCTTFGGNITAVDTYGVVYWRQGGLWRKVGDTGAPQDSPPAGVMLVTQADWGGVYLFDGVAHAQVNIPQVGADPATPANGDIWHRTDTHEIRQQVGGATKVYLESAAVAKSGVNSDITALTGLAGPVVLPAGTSNPGTPVVGQVFYRSDLTKQVTYNGSVWKDAADATVA